MLPLIKASHTGRACGPATFAPSAKGNQQIAIPFEITQGEFTGDTITWIATFHDTPDKNGVTGSDRIIESLQLMGWKGDDLSELTEIDDARARELMPDEVSLACDVETYEGKQRLKVQWINKVGSGRFVFKEPLTGAGLKQFAAQMRGTIRGAQGAARPARPAAQANGGGGGSRPAQERHPNAPEDDIPFASCDVAAEPAAIARVLR